MADSQEPSYYEIALTNRQVLVAFVILLCCVLVAFFAGVWVGRGSPTGASEAQQQVAQPTPSTEPPQELSFFNDQEKGKGAKGTEAQRPDLQDMAKNPRQGTTLAQDLGVESASPTPAHAAPAPASDNGPGEAAPAPSTAAAAPPPAPAATAAGAATSHSAFATDSEADTKAAPAGSLFIQVFSSNDEAQARRLAKKLRGAGLSAFLSPAGGKFRVRIGPFQDRAAAQQAADKARRDFHVDTWVTASP